MKLVKTDSGYMVAVPQDVVDALHLHEGDEIDVQRASVASPERTPERIAAAMRALDGIRRAIPADFKFDREEANARR